MDIRHRLPLPLPNSRLPAFNHPQSIHPFGLDNRSEDSRSDAGVLTINMKGSSR